MKSPRYSGNTIPRLEKGVYSIIFLLSNNLEELTNEPTDVRGNGSQSCIDLICTDLLVVGICHHLTHIPNIILFTVLPCPPRYRHKMWDYKSAKTEELRRELKNTNLHDLFFNFNVNEMSIVFSDRIMEIFSKHILTRDLHAMTGMPHGSRQN